MLTTRVTAPKVTPGKGAKLTSLIAFRFVVAMSASITFKRLTNSRDDKIATRAAQVPHGGAKLDRHAEFGAGRLRGFNSKRNGVSGGAGGTCGRRASLCKEESVRLQASLGVSGVRKAVFIGRTVKQEQVDVEG